MPRLSHWELIWLVGSIVTLGAAYALSHNGYHKEALALNIVSPFPFPFF